LSLLFSLFFCSPSTSCFFSFSSSLLRVLLFLARE
jgi:hypothetical protein